MFYFLCKKIGSFFFWISKKTFIIGVVQDSVETALNSSGDVFFTATAEEFDRKKHTAANGGKNAAK